jgi:hypothetical protein
VTSGASPLGEPARQARHAIGGRNGRTTIDGRRGGTIAATAAIDRSGRAIGTLGTRGALDLPRNHMATS